MDVFTLLFLFGATSVQAQALTTYDLANYFCEIKNSGYTIPDAIKYTKDKYLTFEKNRTNAYGKLVPQLALEFDWENRIWPEAFNIAANKCISLGSICEEEPAVQTQSAADMAHEQRLKAADYKGCMEFQESN